MSTDLTRTDVERLLQDPSPDTRAAMVAKLARTIERTSLTPEQQTLALDIVQAMAHDASVIVREALSANLKSSKHLPRSVALALARDIDAVALPILESTVVLDDEDLVDLVRTVPESKQTAIARRSGLSERVTDALIETDNHVVVRTVVANNGAALSESTLTRVVERYGDAADIHTPLTYRSHLPLTVAERLVAKVSDQLKEYLVTHHELSGDTASELVLRARERATVNLIGPHSTEEDLDKLVAQLDRNGRLSPSLMLRALCVGDMPFFEVALAKLADIPLVNARFLIHDKGPLGLKSIYDRAKLPAALFPAVRLAWIAAPEPLVAPDVDQAERGDAVAAARLQPLRRGRPRDGRASRVPGRGWSRPRAAFRRPLLAVPFE